MKIAYLLLVHDNPAHLERLVGALQGAHSSFFIHVDKKSEIGRFSDVTGERVEYVEPRVPVHWGDFSLVEATMRLVRSAIAHPGGFERFVLISGADYPLQSSDYIHRFFETNARFEFMQLVAMGAKDSLKPLARLRAYRTCSTDSRAKRLARNIAVATKLQPRERDYKPVFKGLVPYGGSGWWALTREACEHIDRFFRSRPEVIGFMKNTRIPDETIFQTILGNSEFRSRIRFGTTYTDWIKGDSHPAAIEERHLKRFQSDSAVLHTNSHGASGEVLFARKFSDSSRAILDQIDLLIRARSARNGEPGGR